MLQQKKGDAMSATTLGSSLLNFIQQANVNIEQTEEQIVENNLISSAKTLDQDVNFNACIDQINQLKKDEQLEQQKKIDRTFCCGFTTFCCVSVPATTLTCLFLPKSAILPISLVNVIGYGCSIGKWRHSKNNTDVVPELSFRDRICNLFSSSKVQKKDDNYVPLNEKDAALDELSNKTEMACSEILNELVSLHKRYEDYASKLHRIDAIIFQLKETNQNLYRHQEVSEPCSKTRKKILNAIKDLQRIQEKKDKVKEFEEVFSSIIEKLNIGYKYIEGDVTSSEKSNEVSSQIRKCNLTFVNTLSQFNIDYSTKFLTKLHDKLKASSNEKSLPSKEDKEAYQNLRKALKNCEKLELEKKYIEKGHSEKKHDVNALDDESERKFAAKAPILETAEGEN